MTRYEYIKILIVGFCKFYKIYKRHILLWCLLLTLYHQNLIAQKKPSLDDIEYNIAEPIFKYKITTNSYIFTSWVGEKLKEKDSLLFKESKFFNNYPSTLNYASYQDSIQFIIVSRTMRQSYHENILYDKDISFVRIALFRELNPLIFRLDDIEKENIRFTFKVGSGTFDRHGYVVLDSSIYLPKQYSKKIKKLIVSNYLVNVKNGVICPKEDLYNPEEFGSPYLIFFEIKVGNNYNIIGINPCYLSEFYKKSSYKGVFKFYKILRKVLNRKNVYSLPRKPNVYNLKNGRPIMIKDYYQ